jgi:hypothetical protein
MRTRTTKKLFEQVISEEVAKHFATSGFEEAEPGAFIRECSEIVHGFGFSPNASVTHFHVPVGVYVPLLNKRLDYIDFGGTHYPTLLVSRWLGEFKEKYTSRDCYYHFATVEQLREQFPKVRADFVEQAEPWLARLTNVEAVASEFYKWRIGPPSTGEVRLPDPSAWAIYGWLLQESGRQTESKPWLEQALEEVRRPRYGKGGQLVPEGTKGARLIPPDKVQIRLREVLEQS